MKTIKTRELILQRDKCAAAILGITYCLRYARLDTQIVTALRQARDYENARIVLLDEQIASGA